MSEMRYALVGAGYWGEKLLRNLVRMVGPERVVVADSSVDRLDLAHRNHPGITCHLNLDDALDDGRVGAAVIATDVASHHRLAGQALRAGCHVLVEKPLASSLTEADELVRLAETGGRILMVGHTYLFSPPLLEVVDLVRNGAIGNIQHIVSNRLNLGLFRDDANVIWDLGPHDLSIVLELMGESPSSVAATAHSRFSDDHPDVAFMSLNFPSGALAQIHVSWSWPHKERRIVIVGDDGMIHFDDCNPEEPIRISQRSIERTTEISGGPRHVHRQGVTTIPEVHGDEPLYRQLEEFDRAITTRAPYRSDGNLGREVVAALDAADRSWRLGGSPVGIESTLRSPAG